MDYYAIGQRIRKNRKAHMLSQEALAEKVGISTTHMSHIETGNTKLSLSVFVDIANALEIRADDLLHDITESSRGSAIESILQLLDTCTTQQLKIIDDILHALKISLERNA